MVLNTRNEYGKMNCTLITKSATIPFFTIRLKPLFWGHGFVPGQYVFYKTTTTNFRKIIFKIADKQVKMRKNISVSLY